MEIVFVGLELQAIMPLTNRTYLKTSFTFDHSRNQLGNSQKCQYFLNVHLLTTVIVIYLEAYIAQFPYFVPSAAERFASKTDNQYYYCSYGTIKAKFIVENIILAVPLIIGRVIEMTDTKVLISLLFERIQGQAFFAVSIVDS